MAYTCPRTPLPWRSQSYTLQTHKNKHLHKQVNECDSVFRRHPMWDNAQPVPPDPSNLSERSDLLWTFHPARSTAGLSGYVIMSGLKVRFGWVSEIWEGKQCSVLTLLIKTLSIPAETLLAWAQPWNKNADSLPSPALLLITASTTNPPSDAAFLPSLSQPTQPVMLHSAIASQREIKATKIRKGPRNGHEAARSGASVCTQQSQSQCICLCQTPTWGLLKLYRLDKMTPNFTRPTGNKEIQVEDPAVRSSGEIGT